MYPHKMFAHLYHDHYGTFKDVILGGDDENIRTFWSQMTGHPSFANHPMHHHQLADFRKYGVPLQLYGDGTPAVGVGKAWSKMVTGITWSSALKKSLGRSCQTSSLHSCMNFLSTKTQLART